MGKAILAAAKVSRTGAGLLHGLAQALLLHNLPRYKHITAIAATGALIVVGVAAFWFSSFLPARTDIVPCKCAVEITPRGPCDWDYNGDCNQDDRDIFDNSIHMCSDNTPILGFEYNALADANQDKCVDRRDLILLYPETVILASFAASASG